MHLVTVDVDQLEALQDHADRKRGLVHRKAAADAGALAVAEWLPGIDRTRGFGFGAEVLRVEGFGVRSPDRRIAVPRHQGHQNERGLLEFVFSADDLVLEWCQAIGRRG